ncbi:Peptidyl-prolyl cis-trans isomerase FKBP65 [Phytophthora citrophthora]|uniref:Peptidyl-prolyl cis-trans isomerase FKBP65 n=1 Tax=Phytophthora citrophthora TaxID=4793 RepID=A0AAD9GQY0_9STRA|nr:Peptidyl-prolyl cis-trans isomerase FKBP65 [Phytophthora citrophthora]
MATLAVEAFRHLVQGKVTANVCIGDQVPQQESVPSKPLHTPPHSNPTRRTSDLHGSITNSGMQVSSVISFLAAAVVVVHADFTAEDQAIWIDRHNYFRTTGLPWSAGDMRRIGWSSDLAATAASTASKCLATTAAGINAFQSTSTNSSSIIDEAIQQWVVETSMTTLKTLAQPGASGVDVGTGTYNSYSQVLWDSTTSVGCATASCSGGDLVVCQYSPAGNDGSSPWYVHADTASDCPSGTTASQGLCIVEGDAANNQIAAIPAGKLAYEVYPAYVANMQTVLIEAARAIASGSDNSTGSATQSTPSATTAAPTATTAAPAAPTATKAPTSETSSSSSTEGSAATKTSTKEDTAEKTSSTKKTTTSSSSSSSSDSTATKTSTTTTSSSSSDSLTKQSSKTTSSSSTDSSETKQSSQKSTSDESAPGTVKASSDTGSTFTNQASTATESPAQQTSSNTASAPSTANTESTTASTTTSSGAAASSINNQSATAAGGGLSAAGMAGMIVLAIVGIAAVGVVWSYKRNQQRQPVTAESFNEPDQAIWIDRHYFRTTGLPWSAGDMRRIGWDAKLATKAASTAATCSATTATGVNAFQSSNANSSSAIDEAIQQWVVETGVTTIKTMAQPGFSGLEVGKRVYNSYSQVVWAKTDSVGCATASCSGGLLVVCEYSPAGNDGKSAWYNHASQASECPEGTTASNGLCIDDGNDANNQIAPIPAGEYTYQVYPTFVADVQSILLNSARDIANGSIPPTTQSSNSSSTTPESKATPPPSTDKKTPKTTPKSSSGSSSSELEVPKETKPAKLPESPSPASPATQKDGEQAPGTVKASSETGSTFQNEAKSPATQNANSSEGTTTQKTESLTTSTGEAGAAQQGVSTLGLVSMFILGIAAVADMSCGFTPDLARMLEQMAVEKERHAVDAKQSLVETEQNAARVKLKVEKVADKQQQENGYDWTRTYEKWEAWEDPEELARQEQEARERSERATKAQMGCNHDHSAEQKLMDMTTKEKLTACDEFRVLGNLFFRHGQYQRAAFHYHKALVYFEYVFTDTDEEEAEADALKLKLLLNFAACRLKTLHLDDAVHHVNQALEIDPENVKALYRRAQAYRLKDEFDLAQKDISQAIEHSKAGEKTQSADSLLMQEKKLLQTKMLAYKLRSKQVSAAMFGQDKPKELTGRYTPGLRNSDVNAMSLNLLKNSDGDSPSSENFPSLNTWQPSTRGLKELQTLITSLNS